MERLLCTMLMSPPALQVCLDSCMSPAVKRCERRTQVWAIYASSRTAAPAPQADKVARIGGLLPKLQVQGWQDL